MFTAIDNEGKRIFIDYAIKGESYFCPACGAPMIVRQGESTADHFAHYPKKSCDLWQSGELSEWHRKMQSLFPAKCQEVVVRDEDLDQSRIADALIQLKDRSVVFEFQHSHISKREFTERTLFYIELGYEVDWVFDFQDAKKPKKIYYLDQYYDTEKDDRYIYLSWPSNDMVRFLNEIPNMIELHESIETGWLKIIFHICPLHLPEAEKTSNDNCERFFVIPENIHKHGLRTFMARCYDESEFLSFLVSLGKLNSFKPK